MIAYGNLLLGWYDSPDTAPCRVNSDWLSRAMPYPCFGSALVAGNLFSIITSTITLQLLTVVIRIILVASGLGLILISIKATQCVALYFGFLQYPAGSGVLLLVAGLLNWDTGMVGSAIGGCCMGWGVWSLALHWQLRKVAGAAVNIQLTTV